MTPTKVKNIRVPLPDGTRLTSRITVGRLLSDVGGSSLTYLAKDTRIRRFQERDISYALRAAALLTGLTENIKTRSCYALRVTPTQYSFLNTEI